MICDPKKISNGWGKREGGLKWEVKRQKEKKQMPPAAHQSKGLVVVKGKTTAKEKSSVKGQTKGPSEGPNDAEIKQGLT